MDDYERIVNKLDTGWHGLFKALRCKKRQLCFAKERQLSCAKERQFGFEKEGQLSFDKERQLCFDKERQLYCGEEWIKDAMSCDYVEKPDWTTLLSGLLSKEPYLVDGQIILKPLFCHLPSSIQKYLLSIFYHHHRSIDSVSLKEFLLKVKDVGVKDTWLEKLRTVLVNILETYNNGTSRNPCSLYQISVNNKDKYTSLLETLRHSGQSYLPLHKVEIQTKADVSREENSPVLFDDDDDDDDDEEPGVINRDASTKVGKDEGDKDDDEDVICIDDDADDDDDIIKKVTDKRNRKLSPRKRQAEDNDKSNSEHLKKLKKENVCTDRAPVPDQETNITNPVPDQLDEDLKVKLSKLQEVWMNCDTDYPEEFDVFVHSPPQQVKLMCDYMKLEDLSEECLETACGHLMSKTTYISYNNSLFFLIHVIKPQFMRLNQMPSRSLVNLMLNLCTTFPKQMMDILTDVITDKAISICQADLMSRFCKECFVKRDNEYWMSKIVASERCLEEPVVSVLQTLIDCKIELSNDVTSNLIGCLSQSRIQLSTSQKFGKFLLLFINKYGKQLETPELSILAIILDSHTTFFKKSAQIAFKKLSK